MNSSTFSFGLYICTHRCVYMHIHMDSSASYPTRPHFGDLFEYSNNTWFNISSVHYWKNKYETSQVSIFKKTSMCKNKYTDRQISRKTIVFSQNYVILSKLCSTPVYSWVLSYTIFKLSYPLLKLSCTHVYSLGTLLEPEVGGWGRDPKKCTGRDWGMGSSTI